MVKKIEMESVWYTLSPEMQEKNLLWKEVAETREKMEEVLQDFLSELWAKHEQTLNLMDDEFFDKSFYRKRKQRI